MAVIAPEFAASLYILSVDSQDLDELGDVGVHIFELRCDANASFLR